MQWIATCLLVSALAVAAEDESSLTVHLLDYADAPTATLIEAEHQVSEIFQDAGIRIVWLNANMNSGQLVPAWNSAAGSELLVNVISRKMNSALGFSQTTLGLTSYEGELPTCAYICFPCITDSANRHADEGERNWWRSVILGSAMAHELGHLLGIRQHSATGVDARALQRRRFNKSADRSIPILCAGEAHNPSTSSKADTLCGSPQP